MLKRRWSSLDDLCGTCNECRAQDVRLSPCDACNAWLYRDLGPATPGGTLPRIKALYCDDCHYDRLCVKCYAAVRSKRDRVSGEELCEELLGLFPNRYEAVPGMLREDDVVPNPLYNGWARKEYADYVLYTNRGGDYPDPPRGVIVRTFQDLCDFCRAAHNRILWRKGVPRGCTCATNVFNVKPYIKLL